MNFFDAKCRLLQNTIGPFLQLSVDQALEHACELEQTCKNLGPFDPAYLHFKQLQNSFFKAAELLEQRDA